MVTVRKLIGLAMLAALSGPSVAARVDLAITNARIIDGAGGIVENGTVLVANGRVRSVSPDVAVDAAVSIDAAGRTLIPGLIDTNASLLATSASGDAEALSSWLENELPTNLGDLLAAGFTTIMSSGDRSGAILSVGRSIEKRRLQGPRLLVAGPVITAVDGGGHSPGKSGNLWLRAETRIQVDGPSAARTAVRELARAGVDAVVVDPGSESGSLGRILDDQTFLMIVDEAAARGLTVIAHTTTMHDVRRAIAMGVDRVHRAPSANEAVTDVAGLQVPVTTAVLRNAKLVDEAGVVRTPFGAEHSAANSMELQTQLENLRTIWDSGGAVAFGSEGSPVLSLAEAVRLEAWLLSETFSSEEVLASMTRNAAAYLNLSEDIGTLEEGKRADMVLLDGDPLSDISALRNVELVIRGGEIVFDDR